MRRRPAAPERVFDAGLQQERTALAWDRTALAMVGSGLVYANVIGAPYVRVVQVPAAVAVVVGAGMLLLGARRYADLHATLRADRPAVRRPYVRAVWLSTVLIGTAAVVAVLRA